MKIFTSLLLSVTINYLFASEVIIEKGWQLLGAQSKITDMSIFDKDGINSVFSYKNGLFLGYPKNSSTELLSEVLAGEGYWINTSKSITLNFDDSSALNVGDIYGVNVVKGWRLLGAFQNLCVNHIFNNSSIQSVWTYDSSSVWKQYTQSNKTELIEIPKGQGYWVNSDEELLLMPYFEISGNIADGYIKDARLEIASLDTGKTVPIVTNPTSLSSTTSVQSDTSGIFSVYINSNSASSYVIRTVGGNDESSGEKFEGVLKGIVPNLGCAKPDTAVRHITPISTMVSKVFSDASKSTKSLRASSDLLYEAEKKIALLIDVNQSSLASDPIALLQSNSSIDKKNAAKLLKSALVIQKTAEIIVKSVTSDSIESDVQQNIEVVMDALAKSLSETTSDFNTTMKDISTLISNSVSVLSDANSQKKLDSVKDILLSTTTFALNIDESKLQIGDALIQIEATQKALEAITIKIEQKLQSVATATSDSSTKAIAAKDVIKAVAISGGVGGTRALIKTQIDRLAINKQKLDISDFADKLLDEDTITQKSEQFNLVFGNEISTNIIEVASNSFKEIIEKKVAGEIVNADEVSSIIAKSIGALDSTVQQDINSKVLTIVEAIVSGADTLIANSKKVADETVLAEKSISVENWLDEQDALLNWQEASSFCTSLSARLPTAAELRSAYLEKISGFDSVHFYWSSTEDSNDSTKAQLVFFDIGSSSFSSKEDKSFVRCAKL